MKNFLKWWLFPISITVIGFSVIAMILSDHIKGCKIKKETAYFECFDKDISTTGGFLSGSSVDYVLYVKRFDKNFNVLGETKYSNIIKVTERSYEMFYVGQLYKTDTINIIKDTCQ